MKLTRLLSLSLIIAIAADIILLLSTLLNDVSYARSALNKGLFDKYK